MVWMEFNENKISILLSLFLLLAFIWIALSVYFEAAWIVRLDNFGNEIFRLDVSQEVTSLIFSFTHLGSIRNLVYVGLVFCAVLLFKKEFHTLLWFIFCGGISGGLAPLVMKNVIRRARPLDGLMTRTGYSFPSGHAMGTLAMYGFIMMMAVIYIKKTWLRRTVIVVNTAIILTISWSRIHLGVHFLSDIIGSLLLGLALLIISWQVFLHINKKRTQY